MARWRVPSNAIFRAGSSRGVKRLEYAPQHEWDPQRISQVAGMVSNVNKAATGVLGIRPLDMITAGIARAVAPGEEEVKPADTREDILRRAAEARTKRDRAAADLRKMRGAGDAGQPGLKPGDLFPEERGKTDFDALLKLQGQDAGAGGIEGEGVDLSGRFPTMAAARRYARSVLGIKTFKWGESGQRPGVYSTRGYRDRFGPRPPEGKPNESEEIWFAELAKARKKYLARMQGATQPQPTGPGVTPLTGIRAPAMTPLTGPAQPRMPGQMPQLKLREDLQPIPGEPEVRAVPNAAAILQMDSGKGGTMMDAFQGRLDAFVDKGEPQYDLSGQLVQPKYTSADLRPLDPQLIGALLEEGPEGGPAFEKLQSLYGPEIAEHIQFIAGDFRPILKTVAASMPQYEKAVVEPVAPIPTTRLLPPSIVEAVEPADRPVAREAGDVGVRGTTAVEDARARERARLDRIISGRREESPAVRAEVVRATGAALNEGRRIPQNSLPNNVNDITAIAMITTDRASLPALIKRARQVARPTKFSDLFTGDHERRATERVLKSFKGGEGFRVTPAQAARIRQGEERSRQGRIRISQAERKSQMDMVRLEDRLANSKSQRERRSIQNQLTSVQFRLKALKYQKLMNRLSRRRGPVAQKTFEGYLKRFGYRTPAEIAKLQGAARTDAQQKLRNFLSRDKTRKWMRRNKFSDVANRVRDNLNVGIKKPQEEAATMRRRTAEFKAKKQAKEAYDAANAKYKRVEQKNKNLLTSLKQEVKKAKELVALNDTAASKKAYIDLLAKRNSLQERIESLKEKRDRARKKATELGVKITDDNAKAKKSGTSGKKAGK